MNENEARQWILDLLDVVKRGAELTPITIDETIVNGAIQAIKADFIWQWVWTIIGPLLDGDGPIIVALTYDVDTEEARQEFSTVGINPMMLLAIVKAILELIKLFRKSN